MYVELFLKFYPKLQKNIAIKFRFIIITRNHSDLNILKGTDYVDVAFVQGIYLEKEFPELKNDRNRKQVRSIQVKSLEEFDELMFVQLLKGATKLLDSTRTAWKL